MTADPKWIRGELDKCVFSESALDPNADSDHSRVAVGSHVCLLCPHPRPAFCTMKALSSHNRAKHGQKNEMRYYVNSSGMCPVCNNMYHTRLRVLAHLCDSRRARCRSAIQQGRHEASRLSSEQVIVLDSFDNQARTDARKAGHTHPIAQVTARTADGKRTGHVKH